MSSADKKDISIPQRFAALAVALEELEKALGEMGGSIMRDNIMYESYRSAFKEFWLNDQGAFIFSLSLSFDANLLCEYAAQAKGQDRGTT